MYVLSATTIAVVCQAASAGGGSLSTTAATSTTRGTGTMPPPHLGLHTLTTHKQNAVKPPKLIHTSRIC